MSELFSSEFLSQYKDKQPNWGFNGLGYLVYKRTYSREKPDGTKEEWWETIERCIKGAQLLGAQYTKEEAECLFDGIFKLKCSFPGRMLWQLGTSTVERFGANSLVNCWFVQINSIRSFLFLFENLMLGGGVGFSIRREDIYQLPKVKKGVKIFVKNSKDADFIVPDSREGWIKLLEHVLYAYFDTGKGFSYSTILVRAAGEPINGFGGVASGPKILEDGVQKITDIFTSREGKRLRSLEVLDVCNCIGKIVVSGNIRRSAQVAIGDPDDVLFLKAKRWDLGSIPSHRAMSNNTIYADDYDHVMEHVWDGYGGNGEPYGFFNLGLAQNVGRLGEKVKDNCAGLNPCQPAFASLLTPFGLSKLGDIREGDSIWSSEGWTKIEKKWFSGIQSVYAFKTKAGIFYGTKEHQVLSEGVKTEVAKAEVIDLLRGGVSEFSIAEPQDVMDGLIIGDGSIHMSSKCKVYLTIGGKDKDYFNSEISNLIVEPHAVKKGYTWKVKTSLTPSELPSLPERAIPERFVYGSTNKVRGFLRGLYSANGSACGNRVTLKSTSLKLIEQVQLMLSSLGIAAYYTTNKPSDIEWHNGNYRSKQSYDLNITVDRVKFAAQIGFLQCYKNEILKQFLNSVHGRTKSSYEVFEVEYLGEMEVFDLMVDNSSHTYWTGGLNVSNCGEIALGNYECCNLAELFLNNITSKVELITYAKLLYKAQKAVSASHFLHEETEEIVHRNMRLGLSISGICQSIDKLDWLDECYRELRAFDKVWSKQKGWNESIKLTTVKPSGTVSVLAGATPGIHPAYSQFYIRRVRIASNDKLVDYCREQGYPIEFVKHFDGSIDRQTVVISFPCEASVNSILAKDMSAIQQLELVKKIQSLWSDNAISVTVYYKKEELKDIRDWLRKNYRDSIKSVSFLLHNEHGFTQAPYEQIDEKVYKELRSKIGGIRQLNNSSSEGFDGLECRSGVCPVR